MYYMVAVCCWLTLACTWPLPATAQSSVGTSARADTVVALEAVLQYRLTWMEDSTRFGACSVKRVLGNPEDPRAVLTPSILEHLDDATFASCNAENTVRAHRLVAVSSITLDSQEPNVRVLVTKSDRVHRETFLLRRDSLVGWVVIGVRIEGSMYMVWPG